MRILNLALAQINSTVGNLDENYKKIMSYLERAKKMGADVVAFPELCLTGYPPEDLLLKSEFIDDNLKYLKKIQQNVTGITAIIGFVDRKDDIYNSAAVIQNKKLVGIYHKIFLPNYGVFDENRYFQAGREVPVFQLGEIPIGVNICEDIWYPGGPTKEQALYGGAEVIINISSSPYHFRKAQSRFRMLSTRAEDNVAIVAYVNMVGGQDELVFDGNSMIVSEEGTLLSKAPSFEESLLTLTLHPDNVFKERIRDPRRRKEKVISEPVHKVNMIPLEKTEPQPSGKWKNQGNSDFLDPHQEVYKALTTGLKDYVTKNRFKKVLIGLSGGIDSALVLSLAVDALGKSNVIAVGMHSQYTSKESIRDARKLSKNFGIKLLEIPIDSLYQQFVQQLKPVFGKQPVDITEENIQARTRGNILMSLSNKFGWLVLATGNKSEVSVGYCTLYGDMVGGFSVIKDVYKTMVYELADYRNRLAGKDIIPKNILTKAPSAELKPNQKDTDSLPPYHLLDPILECYVEKDLSFEEIVNQGYKPAIVKRVMQLVDSNEYKRRQAAPGIKITHRAFGKDRRFPITNHYSG
jgi:NAD+ synthase (glutamine-hydrolysing)